MRTNEPLSPTSQAILAELTAYHHERLSSLEDAARARRAGKDRAIPASLARAVEQMSQPGGLSGAEKEWAQETARLSRNGFDPHRLWIPLSALTRDLNVAQAGAGGYLVDMANLPARDILRPWSVVLQGGVSLVEDLTGTAVVPRTTATTTITWSANETAQATPSNPTIAQAALTPKIAIGVIQASRNFMKQADPEAFIRRELLRTAGTIVDIATLNGSGASGQPLGILNSPNLSTQSGTSLAWAGVLHMKKLAADANAQDGTISFIGTTAVRELLESRERATGGGTFIWQDDRIASCPAFATTVMPSATMLSGPMGEVFFGLWGGGMQVEVNPFDAALFKTGAVQILVIVSCDVAIVCDRAAFTKATSIT
jgi:HK97 family phage major capsid protein